jgi:hypothetical protein
MQWDDGGYFKPGIFTAKPLVLRLLPPTNRRTRKYLRRATRARLIATRDQYYHLSADGWEHYLDGIGQICSTRVTTIDPYLIENSSHVWDR